MEKEAHEASTLDKAKEHWEWEKQDSSRRGMPIGYLISYGQTWKHTHTINIIWTEQAVFVYLGIHFHTHTYMQQQLKKKGQEFEKGQGVVQGGEGGRKEKGNDVIIIMKKIIIKQKKL